MVTAQKEGSLKEIEEVGGRLLSDFYREYRGRSYGMYELVYFAWKRGREDQVNDQCKERNSMGYLQENGDIHND